MSSTEVILLVAWRRCSPGEVEKYLGKLSGPLLDRIDLFVEVSALEFEELSRREPSEPSAAVKERVDQARTIQTQREGGRCNAQIETESLERCCALDQDCQAILKGAFTRMGLTARSYDRILRVARTIADLDGAAAILAHHLAEPIQYRESDYFAS